MNGRLNSQTPHCRGVLKTYINAKAHKVVHAADDCRNSRHYRYNGDGVYWYWGCSPPQTQTLPEDTAGKVFTAVGGEPCAPATCYCRDGIPPPVTVSCPKGLKKKVAVSRNDRYFNMPSLSGTNAQTPSGGSGSVDILTITYGGKKPYTAYVGSQNPYSNVHIDPNGVTSITCASASNIGYYSWTVCLNLGESRAAVCAAAAKAKPECANVISQVQAAIDNCVKWAKGICGIAD